MTAKPETRGRPSLQGAGVSPKVQIRMTQAQADKLKRLGGAPWVRKMIDKARMETTRDSQN